MTNYMQVSQRFGLKKKLDYLYQLIYMSSNLFSSFEIENNLCFLEIDENTPYSLADQQRLLTYFLDLIEYFSHERIYLIQDPTNPSRYVVCGGL